MTLSVEVFEVHVPTTNQLAPAFLPAAANHDQGQEGVNCQEPVEVICCHCY